MDASVKATKKLSRYSGPPTPFACAEERRAWAEQLHRRMQLPRELTHRVCPNGAPTERSEFRGAAHDRAPQVARSEA